jgi:hypothetical protein
MFAGAHLAWTVVLVCPLGGPLGGLHGLFLDTSKKVSSAHSII